MHWSEQIFRYCERGQDPGLMAEPLNAVSNVAFLVAAYAAARRYAVKRPFFLPAMAGVIRLLILLVALIGVGSFLFHVLATRWAQLADVAPIIAFMLLYLGFALRVLLSLQWPMVGAGLGLLIAALGAASVLCPPDKAAAIPPCLNGTAAYIPALLATGTIGVALHRLGRAEARFVLSAAGLLVVSMGMRSADLAACEATLLGAHPRGLHALWHLLNAAALYLLLVAAIKAVNEPARCQDGRDAA